MSRLNTVSEKLNSYPLSVHLTIGAIFSGLIYLLIFTLPFPLSQLYDTIPPVDYTKLTNYSQSGLWLYLFGMGVLFGLYIWAIDISAPLSFLLSKERDSKSPPLGGKFRGGDSGRFVFLSSTIFALILIFSYPLTAIDLFIYAIRTRGWAVYGLPPLSTAPETLPASDPWLGLAAEWIDAPSPYGPLWEWLSLGAFHLSGGDFLAHLFALKIIGALAYLGCVWLVYQILKQFQPNWAIAGTIAFAWNPLVLFESVQNAHNDIVMVFFLLAAIRVSVQSRLKSVTPLLVCLFLALSILVKFVTIIVAPFFLLALVAQQLTWPRRIVSIGLYGLITAAMVVIPMLFVWPGRENWAVIKAGSGAGRSLLALLVLALRGSLGTNPAFDLARNFILAVFALIYLYYLWKTITHLHRSISTSQSSLRQPLPISPPPNLPIIPAFFILFWYVLLAAPVFHAWYLLWFLPLAPFLLPRQRPLNAAIVFSMTALLIIPYFETIRVWFPILLQNHLLGHLIGVPLLILPPALTLLWPISLTPSSEVSSGDT